MKKTVYKGDDAHALHNFDLRETLCAWIRDLGFDPGRVPVDSDIVVDGDKVTFRYYAAEGGPSGTSRVVSMTSDIVIAPITAPLTHPVPESLL